MLSLGGGVRYESRSPEAEEKYSGQVRVARNTPSRSTRKMTEEMPHGETKGSLGECRYIVRPSERHGQDGRKRREKEKRGGRGERRERESFLVRALLIGPRPNFKQVRKTRTLAAGVHYDRRVKRQWGEKASTILESRALRCPFLPHFPRFYFHERRVRRLSPTLISSLFSRFSRCFIFLFM